MLLKRILIVFAFLLIQHTFVILVVDSNLIGIGRTGNCSDITDGQAPFPVHSGHTEACCMKEARGITKEDLIHDRNDKCCIPPGGKCDQESGKLACCNQLGCLNTGEESATCQQKTQTISVMDVWEDTKEKCADPKKPIRLQLDMTLSRPGMKDIFLTNVTYCCDVKMKAKSRMVRLDKYCCGTGFSVCDDVPQQFRRYLSRFRCCGDNYDKKNTTRETNCQSMTQPDIYGLPFITSENITSEMTAFDIQNMRYLVKKTGLSVKELAPIPNPVTDGYGFCSYARSGRYDMTKDLSQNCGSDIWSLCREGKVREGKSNNITCPPEKKFMYQFQSNTNICCTKSTHLHQSSDDEIHKDCCINNFVNTIMHKQKITMTATYLRNKYPASFCKKIHKMKCCSGTCEQDPACIVMRDPSSCYKYKNPAACTVPITDTVVTCEDDYLFDLLDEDYAKIASSKGWNT